MTFAPESLLQVRRIFKDRWPHIADADFGITGGPSHVLVGTSYHLGKDQLKMTRDPYSARTARDLAGLSNAASAFDITDQIGPQLLRAFSVWLVTECRTKAPDTLDIREIIYSPDGEVVLTWDREKGATSFPQQRGDSSHKTHTHISWYRDSEFADRAAVFRRFFAERGMNMWDEMLPVPGSAIYPETGDAPVAAGVMLSWTNSRIVRLERNMDKVLAALEEQQPGAPITDEQLERVLRKIFRSVPE